MTVLALECSGRTLSIALLTPETSWECTINTGFRHAETLMPAVSALSDQAGIHPHSLDLVACSAGPGSFTALRLGMATAKGIARGASCPVKAVPTLELLAAGRRHWPGIVVPVMDARKGRVYAAAFQGNRRLREDEDVPLQDFFSSLPPNQPLLATGPDAPIAQAVPGVTVDPLHASGRGLELARAALEALRKDGPDPPDMGLRYLRASDAELVRNHGA